ncbi:15401_t:CDS:2 [Acaulospora colombiana]|uniref:15401_t:CDS:1 n=1 Tax=Acaulospora colombiana TaxID=27376 RepID=A0ACA9L4Z8_9GLOM|nr:15401_t:CDS:2 [Acaulospora colombiana]
MYPNHEYLKEFGITEDDFKGMCVMSSWAVCGQRPRHGDNENGEHEENDDGGEGKEHDHEHYDFDDTKLHYSGLDHCARENLGYKCKRILDFGRYRYLQDNGFEVELIYYVEPHTSLENLALMAVPTNV